MLAYAASRPVVIDRRPHPNAMLLIIGAHVALAAAVISAKVDLPRRIFDPPPKVFWVPQPTVPPPTAHTRRTDPRMPITSSVDHPLPQVPTKPIGNPPVDTGGQTMDPGALAGGGILVTPSIPKPLASFPMRSGPRLLTPPSELKPPYPASKLLDEEEAVLTLKLSIDENGRVVSVDPVGRADAIFLDAARRYVTAHWRFKPAFEDGRAVTSTTVVTLHFQLDG